MREGCRNKQSTCIHNFSKSIGLSLCVYRRHGSSITRCESSEGIITHSIAHSQSDWQKGHSMEYSHFREAIQVACTHSGLLLQLLLLLFLLMLLLLVFVNVVIVAVGMTTVTNAQCHTCLLYV